MNPVALVLIAIGALGQLLSLVYFFVIADQVQPLLMVLLITLFSSVEVVGVLILASKRMKR